MGNEETPLAKLLDLSNFLESEGTLDENLYQLAKMAAKILNAENSSIMLLNDDEFEELRLRVCAPTLEICQPVPTKAPSSGEKAFPGMSSPPASRS